MLWEHERNYGLGMDALVSVCSGNTNEIMVWAWMLWSAYALGTRTALSASARGALALDAGGPKLLVSPLIAPIVVPYIIPHKTPFKEFRLWFIRGKSLAGWV